MHYCYIQAIRPSEVILIVYIHIYICFLRCPQKGKPQKNQWPGPPRSQWPLNLIKEVDQKKSDNNIYAIILIQLFAFFQIGLSIIFFRLSSRSRQKYLISRPHSTEWRRDFESCRGGCGTQRRCAQLRHNTSITSMHNKHIQHILCFLGFSNSIYLTNFTLY